MIFILVFFTGCLDCLQNGQNSKSEDPPLVEILDIKTPYKNCNELIKDFKNNARQKNQSTNSTLALVFNSESQSDNQSNSTKGFKSSITNLQESSIDEDDWVKSDENLIFIAENEIVKIIDAHDFTIKREINLGKNVYSSTLFLSNKHLIVISQSQSDSYDEIPSYQSNPDSAVNNHLFMPYPISTKTTVSFFEVLIADSFPTQVDTNLVEEFEFDGSYRESRIVNNKLLLIFNESIDFDYLNDEYETVTQNQTQFMNVSCDHIFKKKYNDWDTNITRLFSLNLDDVHAPPHSIGVTGAIDHYYISNENIYLIKETYDWFEDQNNNTQSLPLTITKISLSKNQYSPDFSSYAVGTVRGRIKDRWSLKEIIRNETPYFLISTTTGSIWNTFEDLAENHFWVLKENSFNQSLDIYSSINEFGTGEDIRAVRYHKDIAYIVTFKTTDPLFAIDFSSLENPKIVDQLKIPGFSTYLHPINENRLIGFGYNTIDMGSYVLNRGLQLSLFDTSVSYHLKRLAVHDLGKEGSQSEALSDSHAFYFDSKQNLIGLPVELKVDSISTSPLLNENKSSFGAPYPYPSSSFSGALFFKANDQLEKVGQISHAHWYPKKCRSYSIDGIKRLFTHKDSVIAVSQLGLTKHHFSDLNQTQDQLLFSIPEHKLNCTHW